MPANGPPSPPPQKQTANRLLRALPRADYQRLRPHLRRVHLPLKRHLVEPGKPIDQVYFVERGVVSLVTDLDNGDVVEVATIGNEGMVGLPVFLGADSSPGRAFSQVAGDALSVEASAFRDELDQGGGLRRLLSLYAQALFNQIAQSAACNRSHDIEQRLARWLLMTHDNVGSPEFSMTHEFMSQMLGVRRATVTVVAGALQKARCIKYGRGKVTVVDRERLVARSCACYGVVKAEYDRLLP